MPGNGGRLVFLEDYDMNIARYLVQGVDVWLNTPRRPNEASGTSGEKAALNGVLNFSVLDGWWREGYNGQNGWAIGDDTDYDDPNQQDDADANSMYDTLENEIIPMYYEARSADNLPVIGLPGKKNVFGLLVHNSVHDAMVKEYMNDLYSPAMKNGVKKGKKYWKRRSYDRRMVYGSNGLVILVGRMGEYAGHLHPSGIGYGMRYPQVALCRTGKEESWPGSWVLPSR